MPPPVEYATSRPLPSVPESPKWRVHCKLCSVQHRLQRHRTYCTAQHSPTEHTPTSSSFASPNTQKGSSFRGTEGYLCDVERETRTSSDVAAWDASLISKARWGCGAAAWSAPTEYCACWLRVERFPNAKTTTAHSPNHRKLPHLHCDDSESTTRPKCVNRHHLRRTSLRRSARRMRAAAGTAARRRTTTGMLSKHKEWNGEDQTGQRDGGAHRSLLAENPYCLRQCRIHKRSHESSYRYVKFCNRGRTISCLEPAFRTARSYAAWCLEVGSRGPTITPESGSPTGSRNGTKTVQYARRKQFPHRAGRRRNNGRMKFSQGPRFRERIAM
jgi:hypothetical protein